MSSTSDPTPSMIERAEAWRKFINLLDAYFGEAATALKEQSERSSRLANSFDEKDIQSLVPYFAPRGKAGVNDILPTIISTHESEAKAAARSAKLIGTDLKEELTSLAADIDKSIGDFRGYSASFTSGGESARASESPEASSQALVNGPLKSQIAEYQEAVAAAAAHKSPKVDPYILKLSIDKKIAKLSKKQSRLSDSYAYTQDATKEVDAGITDRLQSIIGRYADAIGNQGQVTLEGSSALLGGFLAHPKLFEYNNFLQSSKAPKAFLSKNAAPQQPQTREQSYPDEDSIYSKALRTGELERRTKFLHTYSPGDYVLTPQSLIELKNGLPAWSLDLIGAKLLENHKAADANQFVLQARQHGSSSGRLHTFVFRARVAQNWRRELAAITAGEIPPSLEAIVHAQHSNAANTVIIGDEPTGAKTEPSNKAAAGAQSGNAPTFVSTPVPPTNAGTSKAAEPASSVAGAGGAATSGRPEPANRLDSTDAIAPSSKYRVDPESPSQTGGIGPEPIQPFPKIDSNKGASANPSANPFGEPPSNESLTGVPVAGVAGAAAGAAAAPRGLNTSDETPTAALSSLSTQEPGSGAAQTNNPFGSSADTSQDRYFGQSAPFDYKENQLQHPVDKEGLAPGVGAAGAAGLGSAAAAGATSADERYLGQGAPYDLRESQLTEPLDDTSGSTDRVLGQSAPYDLKESQLQHPVDRNAGGTGAWTGPGIGNVAPEDRYLGKSAPYDFEGSQLQHPIDREAPQSGANAAATGAAAGTVAGGASGFNSRGPSNYVDRLHDNRGSYDYPESKLSHPVDKVNPSLGAAGAGAAGSQLDVPASHHDSDSEMSDAEQDFDAYFDGDDREGPREGTLAWQARHDMQVFDKPVGYKAVEDPRPSFAATADDDDASVWSYDAKNRDGLNTFRNDDGFRPSDYDVPVHLERRLTNTQHKYETPIVEPMRTEAEVNVSPEEALQRRRSSVNAHTAGKHQRSPSRRATGSYGDEEGSLKPLSGLSSEEKLQAMTGDSPLVFSEGLPKTTGGPSL